MRRIREYNKNLRENSTPTFTDKVDQPFVEKRSGPADRRKKHTFILNDRRSGIADRRRKPRFRH
jgi:hypothetical protein